MNQFSMPNPSINRRSNSLPAGVDLPILSQRQDCLPFQAQLQLICNRSHSPLPSNQISFKPFTSAKINQPTCNHSLILNNLNVGITNKINPLKQRKVPWTISPSLSLINQNHKSLLSGIPSASQSPQAPMSNSNSLYNSNLEAGTNISNLSKESGVSGVDYLSKSLVRYVPQNSIQQPAFNNCSPPRFFVSQPYPQQKSIIPIQSNFCQKQPQEIIGFPHFPLKNSQSISESAQRLLQQFKKQKDLLDSHPNSRSSSVQSTPLNQSLIIPPPQPSCSFINQRVILGLSPQNIRVRSPSILEITPPSIILNSSHSIKVEDSFSITNRGPKHTSMSEIESQNLAFQALSLPPGSCRITRITSRPVVSLDEKLLIEQYKRNKNKNKSDIIEKQQYLHTVQEAALEQSAKFSTLIMNTIASDKVDLDNLSNQQSNQSIKIELEAKNGIQSRKKCLKKQKKQMSNIIKDISQEIQVNHHHTHTLPNISANFFDHQKLEEQEKKQEALSNDDNKHYITASLSQQLEKKQAVNIKELIKKKKQSFKEELDKALIKNGRDFNKVEEKQAENLEQIKNLASSLKDRCKEKAESSYQKETKIKGVGKAFQSKDTKKITPIETFIEKENKQKVEAEAKGQREEKILLNNEENLIIQEQTPYQTYQNEENQIIKEETLYQKEDLIIKEEEKSNFNNLEQSILNNEEKSILNEKASNSNNEETSNLSNIGQSILNNEEKCNLNKEEQSILNNEDKSILNNEEQNIQTNEEQYNLSNQEQSFSINEENLKREDKPLLNNEGDNISCINDTTNINDATNFNEATNINENMNEATDINEITGINKATDINDINEEIIAEFQKDEKQVEIKSENDFQEEKIEKMGTSKFDEIDSQKFNEKSEEADPLKSDEIFQFNTQEDNVIKYEVAKEDEEISDRGQIAIEELEERKDTSCLHQYREESDKDELVYANEEDEEQEQEEENEELISEEEEEEEEQIEIQENEKIEEDSQIETKRERNRQIREELENELQLQLQSDPPFIPEAQSQLQNWSLFSGVEQPIQQANNLSQPEYSESQSNQIDKHSTMNLDQRISSINQESETQLEKNSQQDYEWKEYETNNRNREILDQSNSTEEYCLAEQVILEQSEDQYESTKRGIKAQESVESIHQNVINNNDNEANLRSSITPSSEEREQQHVNIINIDDYMSFRDRNIEVQIDSNLVDNKQEKEMKQENNLQEYSAQDSNPFQQVTQQNDLSNNNKHSNLQNCNYEEQQYHPQENIQSNEYQKQQNQQNKIFEYLQPANLENSNSQVQQLQEYHQQSNLENNKFQGDQLQKNKLPEYQQHSNLYHHNSEEKIAKGKQLSNCYEQLNLQNDSHLHHHHNSEEQTISDNYSPNFLQQLNIKNHISEEKMIQGKGLSDYNQNENLQNNHFEDQQLNYNELEMYRKPACLQNNNNKYRDAQTSPIKTIDATLKNNASQEENSNLLFESKLFSEFKVGQELSLVQPRSIRDGKEEEEYYSRRRQQIQSEIRSIKFRKGQNSGVKNNLIGKLNQQNSSSIITASNTAHSSKNFQQSIDNQQNSNLFKNSKQSQEEIDYSSSSVQQLAIQKREEILDRIKSIDAQLQIHREMQQKQKLPQNKMIIQNQEKKNIFKRAVSSGKITNCNDQANDSFERLIKRPSTPSLRVQKEVIIFERQDSLSSLLKARKSEGSAGREQEKNQKCKQNLQKDKSNTQSKTHTEESPRKIIQSITKVEKIFKKKDSSAKSIERSFKDREQFHNTPQWEKMQVQRNLWSKGQKRDLKFGDLFMKKDPSKNQNKSSVIGETQKPAKNESDEPLGVINLFESKIQKRSNTPPFSFLLKTSRDNISTPTKQIAFFKRTPQDVKNAKQGGDQRKNKQNNKYAHREQKQCSSVLQELNNQDTNKNRKPADFSIIPFTQELDLETAYAIKKKKVEEQKQAPSNDLDNDSKLCSAQLSFTVSHHQHQQQVFKQKSFNEDFSPIAKRTKQDEDLSDISGIQPHNENIKYSED